MMADFYTKPLQGTLFRKFRDQIMNIGPTVVPPLAHRSVLEPESGAVHNTNDVTSDGWVTVQGQKKSRQTMTTQGHCVTY
jgi:hypothetical protein